MLFRSCWLQPAFAVFEANILQCGFLEFQHVITDFVLAVRSIGEIHQPTGHLRGKPQQIQRRVARRLDAPVELARENACATWSKSGLKSCCNNSLNFG